MCYPITYGVYEDVVDRKTNKRLESTLICECPDYVRAQRVMEGLDETIYSKGSGGTFYIEYRVSFIEEASYPWD